VKERLANCGGRDKRREHGILMYSLILSEMVYPMPLWILIVKVALDFGMADSKSSSWLRNRGGGEELWIFYMYTRQLRSAIYIRPNCSTVYYSNMCGNRTFLHRRLDFCPVEYNVNIYINCPSQRAGTILVWKKVWAPRCGHCKFTGDQRYPFPTCTPPVLNRTVFTQKGYKSKNL
jgi:hypothetical protein